MAKFNIFGAFLILWTGCQTAFAQSYPPGLSEAAVARFEIYETRIIEALRESRSSVDVREMPTAFASRYAITIFADVFGEDWSAIKAYADAALAALPYKDETERLKSAPVEQFDMGDEARKLLTMETSDFPAFELGVAANRMWEPDRDAGGRRTSFHRRQLCLDEAGQNHVERPRCAGSLQRFMGVRYRLCAHKTRPDHDDEDGHV